MLAGTQACGDEEGNFFSINGRAVVTKATGKLAKAKGNLKVTGSYDRAAGTFSAKFSGKLKQVTQPVLESCARHVQGERQ